MAPKFKAICPQVPVRACSGGVVTPSLCAADALCDADRPDAAGAGAARVRADRLRHRGQAEVRQVRGRPEVRDEPSLLQQLGRQGLHGPGHVQAQLPLHLPQPSRAHGRAGLVQEVGEVQRGQEVREDARRLQEEVQQQGVQGRVRAGAGQVHVRVQPSLGDDPPYLPLHPAPTSANI